MSFRDVSRLEGESAFILGNGPSLNDHNLDRLKDLPSFASNAVFLAFERYSWRPSHYSCVDTAVLPDRRREISKWVKRLSDTVFFFPKRMVPHSNDFPARETNVDRLIRPRRNVCYFEPRKLDLNGDHTDVFSVDTDEFVVDPMTVTITLMQLAVKLGVRRLFLIGCDTDYHVPVDAVSLDEDSSRVDKRIMLEKDTDPNHFDPRYFGKGKIWHTPNPELMISHYEKSYEVCLQNGIEVFNAGRGGKLEVFPRVDYEKALSMCSKEASGIQ